MSVTIEITETREVSEDSWEVMVTTRRRPQHNKTHSCDEDGSNSPQSHLATVQNPFGADDSENLRWQIEEHAEIDPFDVERARRIGSKLDEYAASLVRGLGLDFEGEPAHVRLFPASCCLFVLISRRWATHLSSHPRQGPG